MDKIAGVTFIETYSHVSVWAILVLVLGSIFFVLTLVSLAMTAEKDDTKYIPTFCIFLVATIICACVGLSHVQERGFRAKVDNINAWAEISLQYRMIGLDDNGIFTFEER